MRGEKRKHKTKRPLVWKEELTELPPDAMTTVGGMPPLHKRQNRQGFLVAIVAAAASLVLLSIVSLCLPNLRVSRAELDSTAGLPEGWHKDVDSGGRTYYWNRKLGTSSWTPPTASRTLVAPQPTPKLHDLPWSEYVDKANTQMGWDQMAVPLNQLRRSERRAAQPRTLQSLAPEGGAAEAEGEEEEKKYGDLTPDSGWPHDLIGATGDDTSWIVGMHREPLWTDSMTHACGLTDPCPTGRADRGHGMQMDSNPYNDRRRIFDPYAFGDAYSDPANEKQSSGRNNYPWDPTRDAQFYGKKGADCSNGNLKDDCYERPSMDHLRQQQTVWTKKYNEFASHNVGEQEAKFEQFEAPKKEKSEEVKAAEAKAKEGVMKKDGLQGALLHLPEITDPTPWARSIRTGMLKAEQSVKTGMLHASAEVTATAEKAAYEAGEKKKKAYFIGGEPVLASLDKMVKKVKAAYTSGDAFFSPAHVSELERKFLRANQKRLSGHQAMRAFDSASLRPKKSSTTLLAAIHLPSSTLSEGKLQGTQGAAGKGVKVNSIWESPAQVAAQGLYGSAEAAAEEQQRAQQSVADKKRVAAAKVLASVRETKKAKGPLPLVRDEAIKVAEEAATSAVTLINKVTGKITAAPWEEANIQKGVLRQESTESNLMQLVKEHDDKLLQEASGLSATELKKAMDDANKESKGNKKAVMASKALAPWQQKVAQQGTLKHETVEQNLKSALKAREKMLWKEKTGWRSVKDMKDAEAFADNLEREIKIRRQEEATHPLIPTTASSLLKNQHSKSTRGVSNAQDVKERAKRAAEQRELDKLREGEPLVKALQEEVENDEQSLATEAEQQHLTLKQLREDQGKLNQQLKLEEAISPEHPTKSATTNERATSHGMKNLKKVAGISKIKKTDGTDGDVAMHGLSGA